MMVSMLSSVTLQPRPGCFNEAPSAPRGNFRAGFGQPRLFRTDAPRIRGGRRSAYAAETAERGPCGAGRVAVLDRL